MLRAHAEHRLHLSSPHLARFHIYLSQKSSRPFPMPEIPRLCGTFPPNGRGVPYLSNSASHPSLASQTLFVFLVSLRATALHALVWSFAICFIFCTTLYFTSPVMTFTALFLPAPQALHFPCAFPIRFFSVSYHLQHSACTFLSFSSAEKVKLTAY